MRARSFGCCFADIMGSWIKSCQDGQLEDIELLSSGLEGEIVEFSPYLWAIAHIVLLTLAFIYK